MTTATANLASPPQHMRALEYANHIRLARAELKRRVASGAITAADVITDSPAEAERMTVSELLMAQRRWGRTRCRKLLNAIPISETKTIGSMTERQRTALAALLGDRKHGIESSRAERPDFAVAAA